MSNDLDPDRVQTVCKSSQQMTSLGTLLPLQHSLSFAGKTMAYAIPIVEDLQSQQPKIQRHDGPVAMVIVPTREVRNHVC